MKMSKAEEHFMETKSTMTSAIGEFYRACQAIEINDEGFVEDIGEAVFSSTETEDNTEGIVLSDYI